MWHTACRANAMMDSVVNSSPPSSWPRARASGCARGLPKVLHQMCGRPLIAYPLRLAQTLADRVVMVVGPGTRRRPGRRRSGRGDRRAARAARHRPRRPAGPAACPAEGVILVLAGDMPLLSARDPRAARRAPPGHRRGRHRADRGGRAAAGLRARATAGRAREAHRRGPRRDGRREEGHRDQHQRLLLRRAAAVARAGRGPAGQRPGRALPDRRRRAAGARRRAGGGGAP